MLDNKRKKQYIYQKTTLTNLLYHLIKKLSTMMKKTQDRYTYSEGM